MSDLIYQNYSNKCKGWVNPSNLFFGPEIISLTGYQSPSGSNTVVSIIGTNFFSYSIIRFGTFTPTVYFINSTLLSFYVPNTLTSGTFPVQVCNGSVCSNIINYTIDNASGYWLLNSNGTISNTNSNGGISVSWLSRGSPLELFNNVAPGPYNPSSPYKLADNVNWIICDGGGLPIYIELPSGNSYNGREIMFKSITINSNIISTTTNIKTLDGSTITNLIVSATTSGNWSTLVYNASQNAWIIMQANWV